MSGDELVLVFVQSALNPGQQTARFHKPVIGPNGEHVPACGRRGGDAQLVPRARAAYLVNPCSKCFR